MDMLEICRICSQTKEWHKIHQPKHQFVGLNDSDSLHEVPSPTPAPIKMGDPVLRLTLIKAKVITEADITESEVWLREAANQGKAVVVVDGEFKLLTIEEWIAREARVG